MSEALRRLADRLGIEASYTDLSGATRETSESTRAALLAALGFAAADGPEAERRLEGLDGLDGLDDESVGTPAPARPCFAIDEALGKRRAFGLHVNLPALRRRGGWGVGGFAELGGLVDLAASWGADFVAVSPLHALAPECEPASPYSPLSRRFRNALLVDPEAVPELPECEQAQALLAERGLAAERLRLVRSASLHPARVAALQRPVLQALHRCFRERHEGRPGERGRAHADFLKRQGAALEDFATFMALREAAGPGGALPPKGSAAAERFRLEHEEAIAFHRYLQFELERQLRALGREAKARGLGLGLIGDLALGSVRDGAEIWAAPKRFLLGASLGAPPDPLGPDGQEWGLPPWNPRELRAEDFAPWRELLRAAFTGAGGLRVDHVLGLVRQFLVPLGQPASEGAYLRQPSGELLRVLAEESRRARAIVVGEDLGTLPPELPALLERHGLLSTRVLRFERRPDGSFPPSAAWPERALALAGTHDLPPLAGWLTGRDLELRARLGRLDAGELERSRETRHGEAEALCARLRAESLLAEGEPSPASFTLAVHRFLLRTPSALVALQLEDLLGESEAFNVPGLPSSVHPSWSRPLPALLEELAGDPRIAARLPCERERERSKEA